MPMILHTLNKPPSRTELWQSLVDTMADGDLLILIEDGCYHALNPSPLLAACPKVAVLTDDAEARGIEVGAGIERISYPEWVQLCTQFPKVISWY
jgi:sulfur relay protein TusB/DsrH